MINRLAIISDRDWKGNLGVMHIRIDKDARILSIEYSIGLIKSMPEMTVLHGGMRVLNINFDRSPDGFHPATGGATQQLLSEPTGFG